jgi:hypothetical protein
VTLVYGPPETCDRYTLYPATPDEVLASHVKTTLAGVVPEPVPVTGMVTVPALAVVVVIATLPVTLPLFFGANCTVRIALCPGPMLVPLPTPLALIPAPLALTDDTFTVEFPLFVSETVELFELPIATVPKLTLVGEGVSAPVAVTAWPTSGIVTPDPDPLTDSVSIPAAVVVLVGENVMLNVVELPFPKVSGVASPEVANPLPWIDEDVITALPVPELLS